MNDLDDKELQLRKRRRLDLMIRKSSGYPSFAELLTTDFTQEIDEAEEAEALPEPPPVPQLTKPLRVSLDVALGLRDPVQVDDTLTPAAEGWYEGVVSPISLPEDADYLSPLHQWIRNNLEFFSASDSDSGRRTTVVRGKVGVRCIHCAKSDHVETGATSYPSSISAMYSACVQKPQLHFEHCSNLSPETRAQFQAISQSKRRRRDGNVPAAVYYAIAARRIGLVDVPDGMRFSRDLSLEPLPFETVRAQVESELKVSAPTALATTPEAAVEPRLAADEDSERVLAQAVMEKDERDRYLSRAADKAKVSDYFFLTIRQMALCYAMAADFATKGKKTRLMRIGFAGFCCRHCMHPSGIPSRNNFSCRSFSSAADNLSSSITNSFSTHLQKCDKVPLELKKALVAYRKIHHRQLAQLPYGSQRRLIHELWTRLREADLTEEQMTERLKDLPQELMEATSFATPVEAPRERIPGRTTSTVDTSDIPQSRPESLPVCEDAETHQLLQEAEEDWDPETNDNLILPSERWLVSDYVFLTIRQLKIAAPDVPRGRRSGSAMAGICCMHCYDQDQLVSPSGRAFPSAPDNFASALNSSLRSHMQACNFVPTNIKRALANLRKMHSSQCSSLKFGSQRRFFNILFDRLKDYTLEFDGDEEEEEEATETLDEKAESGSCPSLPSASKEEMEEMEFLMVSRQLFLCRRCRMVPVQFRALGAVHDVPPTAKQMKHHRETCAEDGFSTTALANCVRLIVQEDLSRWEPVVALDSFKKLIEACVGGDSELTDLFVTGFKQARRPVAGPLPGSKGAWARIPSSVDVGTVKASIEYFASEQRLSIPRVQNFCLLICPCLA